MVVPDLDRVDRCVSCHLGLDDPRMTDVPQPFKVHPPPTLEDHDIDKFGCTACHLGQGRATNAREAHAVADGVFWERPMLPAPLTQSSCGVCHNPEHLADRGAPLLAAGLETFRSAGCLGCHKLGGKGGVLGPALDREGDKGAHALPFAHLEGERTVWTWHREHLRAPEEVVPDSQMPAVDLDDEGIDALTIYLLSLRAANLTERMTPRDRYEQRYRVWHTPPLSGEELYQQFCFACHEEGEETVLHDGLDIAIPSIRHPDFLAVASEDFLTANIRDGRPGTPMPAWGPAGAGLSEDEIARLVGYLLESREEVREITFVPSSDPDPENGERIFREECTDCHGLTFEDSEASWLGSPGFQETYGDALIGHTIIYGRDDTLMIGYGVDGYGDLTDQEVSDVVAFIRTLE